MSAYVHVPAGGVVITETVFGLNGIGRLAIVAIGNQDLPTIMGVVIVGALFTVLANLVVDLVYVLIDPRVRVPA